MDVGLWDEVLINCNRGYNSSLQSVSWSIVRFNSGSYIKEYVRAPTTLRNLLNNLPDIIGYETKNGKFKKVMKDCHWQTLLILCKKINK